MGASAPHVESPASAACAAAEAPLRVYWPLSPLNAVAGPLRCEIEHPDPGAALHVRQPMPPCWGPHTIVSRVSHQSAPAAAVQLRVIGHGDGVQPLGKLVSPPAEHTTARSGSMRRRCSSVQHCCRCARTTKLQQQPADADHELLSPQGSVELRCTDNSAAVACTNCACSPCAATRC